MKHPILLAIILILSTCPVLNHAQTAGKENERHRKEMSPLNWNKHTHCYDRNAKIPTLLYVVTDIS